MGTYLSEIMGQLSSTVPEGYEGRCKVILDPGHQITTSAVFPNLKEATTAAHIAINPVVGGYGYAEIVATEENVTHDYAIDWLMA